MPETGLYPSRRAYLASVTRQVFFSIPHYLRELATLRTTRDWYAWVYYKWPLAFPLAAFPPYVTVEVTNACNLACRHCWRSVMSRPVGFIDAELFREIVGQINKDLPITLKVGGTGEAALHPKFHDLIDALNPFRHLRVIVYRNGLLLRKLPHNTILNSNIRTIVVSVDGIDQASYNRIRVGGDYSLLREQIEAFYALRNSLGLRFPAIEIRHTIMPDETSRQIAEFRKRWLGTADTVKFNYLVPLVKSDNCTFPSVCRHIFRELCIEWDGRVRLCTPYPEYLGDIHSSTITELWHCPAANFVRDCHKRRDFGQIPVCRGCS